MPFYRRRPSDSTSLERVEAEAWVLLTDPGQRLLAEVATVSDPGPANIERWRRSATPQAVAAAIRLTACRRKADDKFSRADRMWLDPVGLEQSTSEIVARHKARRYECPVVVDLCSGLGGDSLALAQASTVLAVDLDPGMCRRLRWNASVYDVGDRLLPCRASADRYALPSGAWVHIDPDRRAAGNGRARSVAGYEPDLSYLLDLAARVPGGAIKLGPASDFARHFAGPRLEVELVSLRGECKEATIWFGEAVTCRRRATCLPNQASWTDREGDSGTIDLASSVGRFVFDPDPALVRAGLVDSFAGALGLKRVLEGVDYLTGDRPIASPLLSGYEVSGVHRLDMKSLRALIKAERVGRLDIKVRGIALDPNLLRTQLQPRGDRKAVLLIAGGSRSNMVILAISRLPDDATPSA